MNAATKDKKNGTFIKLHPSAAINIIKATMPSYVAVYRSDRDTGHNKFVNCRE